MKKQINPTIKAHLIRGAFYLLLLLAVCAIPFALAQRNRGAQAKRGQASGQGTAATVQFKAGFEPRSGGIEGCPAFRPERFPLNFPMTFGAFRTCRVCRRFLSAPVASGPRT